MHYAGLIQLFMSQEERAPKKEGELND